MTWLFPRHRAIPYGLRTPAHKTIGYALGVWFGGMDFGEYSMVFSTNVVGIMRKTQTDPS